MVDRFPDRKRTKTIDGVAVAGWFTEDFTPAEIGTLEREGATGVPRPHKWDGLDPAPTFNEVIE